MIVVTGVGRSGTSFVARLYKELGFDPGGEWYPEMNAGLEDPEVVRLNERIRRDLGIAIPQDDLPPALLALWRRLPAPVHRVLAPLVQPLPESFTLRARVRWGRLGGVVRKHAPALVDAAKDRAVVKDPRFTWTLGVWAAAGAPIDHVLVCVRDLDASFRSRVRLGALPPSAWERTKNIWLYQFGICMRAIYEHGLPYDVVRFPEVIEEPERLYEAMSFPDAVPKERFLSAFRRVADPTLVHER